jgi:type I restriction enzyme, S subunit
MNKAKLKQTELGEIPESWDKVLLKDVAVVNEKTIDKEYSHTNIEYVDIASVDKGRIFETKKLLRSEAPSRAQRIVRDNDILLSTVRPNLKHFAFMKRTNPNTIVSTGFAVISSKTIDSRFLYYYLTTDRYTDYLSAIADAHTSTYPAFNPDILENSEIPFPPEKEQRAIAKILSDLDEKIELNRQMNKTLEAIGQTLFKQWFVDFEFPDKNGKPYKSSGGRMVDSELGETPEGWEVKPLDKIAEFLNGLALQKYPPKDDRYLPVIKIRELNQGITESTDKASSEIDNEYIIEDGDILFSWSGSLQVCIWCQGKGALNQHLFKVSSSNYSKWFYFYGVKFHLPEFQHIAQGKATTMGHIQRHHLSSALVTVPPKTVLASMNQIMAPLIEQIIINGIEIRQLSLVRDSLLPRLMSGKMRVNS